MDDILASIRKIIAEEPIGSRSVPGTLHDGPPGSTHPIPPKAADRVALGPSRPFAREPVLPMPPANGPAVGQSASLDDDLFEPEPLQSAYVTPQPPRDLIFTPTPFSERPAPQVEPHVEAGAADHLLISEQPEAAALEAAEGQDGSMPSLEEIAAALKLKSAADIASPVAVEPAALELAPVAPTATTLAPEPDNAAPALDTSVEDLLGALAAGLAQQVPPTAEKTAETTAVTEDDARKAVADAIAAVTASNVPPVAEVIAEEPIIAAPIEATVSPAVELADAQEVEPVLAVAVETNALSALPVVEASDAPAAAPELVPAAEKAEVPRAAEATAAAAAAAAVAAAAHAAPSSPAAPDVSEAPSSSEVPQVKAFEDAVTAMLRPLIKDWLDRHMPDMVARALDAELKSRLPR